MDFEREISEFYLVKKKYFTWTNKDDALADFYASIKPALDDIGVKLKPFVKRVKVTENLGERVFSANLFFEEKDLGKFAFNVEIELNNPYIKISTYDSVSERSYFLRLDINGVLTRELITSEFRVFFRGRN